MKHKFILAFSISLAIFLVVGSFLMIKYADDIRILANNNPNPKPPTETVVSNDENTEENSDEYEEEIEFDNNELTFLMIGIDALDEDQTESIRSDTIMVVKVNFDDGSLNLLSIPRDTRLKVKGSLDKVNHAHSYGGIDLTIKTVNDFLGTNIENYVSINYTAVKEIVDTIGGVDIYVPRRMEYYDPAAKFRVDLQKGQQILDGEKSMQFLRWRNNNKKTAGYKEGDVGRIETQQYFLKEFIKQAIRPKNIIKFPQFINTYLKHVDTNLSVGYILKGISMANKLDTENMNMQTVPGYGTYIDEISYYVYNQKQLETVIEEMGFR